MADEFDSLFDDESQIVNDGSVIPSNDFDEKFEENFFGEPEKGEGDLVTELLKLRGITNNSIKLIGDDNEEKEVNFYDLPREEQLQILLDNNKDEEEDNDLGLSDDEAELLNYLRENKLTVNQYLDLHKQDILKDIQNPNQVYEIDSYDDEELFLLDLKSKFDLSEEELAKELEKELKDKELFTKKVSKLRTDYKGLEDAYKQQQEAEFNAQREEQYNTFVDSMVDVAINNSELYGFELEDDDKDNVLSFILDLDDNGTSEFYKALNNPVNLYKAAWFLSQGENAFNILKNAYDAEIAKLKQDTKKIIVKQNENKNTFW